MFNENNELVLPERIAIQHHPKGLKAIVIDGEVIDPKEIKAHLALFANSAHSQLTDDIAKTILLMAEYSKVYSLDQLLCDLSLQKQTPGGKTDTTGQYLCVLLSDLLEIRNIDIANILGWITATGQNYDRMIKQKKKLFYAAITEKYKVSALSNEDFSDINQENGTLEYITEKYILDDTVQKLNHTIQIAKEKITTLSVTNPKLANSIKHKIDLIDNTAITRFTEKVLHKTKKN